MDEQTNVLTMKVTTIYETAHTDGYTHTGDGRYFASEYDAEKAGKERYKAYAVSPIPRKAVEDEDGRYYLIKENNPVSLFGSKQAKEDIAAAALKKLTKEEKEALGL